MDNLSSVTRNVAYVCGLQIVLSSVVASLTVATVSRPLASIHPFLVNLVICGICYFATRYCRFWTRLTTFMLVRNNGFLNFLFYLNLGSSRQVVLKGVQFVVYLLQVQLVGSLVPVMERMIGVEIVDIYLLIYWINRAKTRQD